MAVQLTDTLKNKQFQGIKVRFYEHPLPQFQWFHYLINSIYVSQTPTNIYDGFFEDDTKAALQDNLVELLWTWWTAEIVGKSSASNVIERARFTNLL